MNIAFDGKRAVQNYTGLGNYSRYVVEILSEYAPEHSYILLAPKDRQNNRLDTVKSRTNVVFRFPQGFWKKISALWRTVGIRADLQTVRADIFHGLSNEIPVGLHKAGIRSVVSIHDLIFLRYPKFYPPIDRLIYRIKFSHACRNADRIIAVSECTGRDIIRFFGIPGDKIKVVYQGCHPMYHVPVPDEVKKQVADQYRLPPAFILYVGSIEERKNLLLVAKALKLSGENIHLVAVGKHTPYQDRVQQYVDANGLTARFHVFNRVSFTDLPAFYQLARIFIYPSFFEGFGIPIIEALASGTPVIAATGSCLEEAGGPDSFYIDPENDSELAARIEQVWNDTGLSERMSAAGKQYVQKFADKAIAKEIMDVYHSLVQRE
jgi:glycosyltransferase involved in cell wall biosynthesis